MRIQIIYLPMSQIIISTAPTDAFEWDMREFGIDNALFDITPFEKMDLPRVRFINLVAYSKRGFRYRPDFLSLGDPIKANGDMWRLYYSWLEAGIEPVPPYL